MLCPLPRIFGAQHKINYGGSTVKVALRQSLCPQFQIRVGAYANKKLKTNWQTRATRLEVSQGHKTVPFQWHSFLLVWNSNFSDIRLQKMSWPWNPDQRSLKVIESGTILYTDCGFLLVFLVILYLRDIQLVSMQWPWNPS